MAELTDDQIFDLRKLELEHKHQLNLQELELKGSLVVENAKADRNEAFEARREYARHMGTERLQMERNLKEYGQLALRSLFILNAGAVVVLLAFIGNLMTKGGEPVVPPVFFVPSLMKFAIALACIGAALTLAYINGSSGNRVGDFRGSWRGKACG